MEPLGATSVFLVICVSCLLFLSAWRKVSGSGKLPPGPLAFPIIGNTLQLNMRNLPQSIHEVRGLSPYPGLWLRWVLSRDCGKRTLKFLGFAQWLNSSCLRLNIFSTEIFNLEC